MIVETITMVKDEEVLLPFFIKHYDFVDKMNFLYDTRSTDGTLEILKSCSKANVLPVSFPGGWNSLIKQLLVEDIYNTLNKGWALLVDVDEFAFMNKSILKEAGAYRIWRANFYDVFRHISEGDLDIGKTIKEQRKHGVLDPVYSKPVIVQVGRPITWVPGCYSLAKPNISKKDIPILCNGAHWATADPVLIDRRLSRKSDRSVFNKRKGYGGHVANLTEEGLIKEYKKRSNEPKVW